MEDHRPTKYAIGPFSFDDQAGTVTLAPGVYSLCTAIVLKNAESVATAIEGVEYESPAGFLFDAFGG